MADSARVRRPSGSSGLAPARIRKVCRFCYVFSLIVAGFCVVIGPAIFLMITFESLGGATAVWTPEIRYYGRIIGGTTFGVGVFLLFLSHQCYNRTENSLISVLTRYRRHRRVVRKPLPDVPEVELVAPPSGCAGDTAVSLDEIPLYVTVSDVPLMGSTSDHSVLSHHMTIESWFSKKLQGRGSAVVRDDPPPLVHLKNELLPNNTREGVTGQNYNNSSGGTTDFNTENQTEDGSTARNNNNSIDGATVVENNSSIDEDALCAKNEYYIRVENPGLVIPKELGWENSSHQSEQDTSACEEIQGSEMDVCCRGSADDQPGSKGLTRHQHLNPETVCLGTLSVGREERAEELISQPEVTGTPAVQGKPAVVEDNEQNPSPRDRVILEAIASLDRFSEELDAYQCPREEGEGESDGHSSEGDGVSSGESNDEHVGVMRESLGAAGESTYERLTFDRPFNRQRPGADGECDRELRRHVEESHRESLNPEGESNREISVNNGESNEETPNAGESNRVSPVGDGEYNSQPLGAEGGSNKECLVGAGECLDHRFLAVSPSGGTQRSGIPVINTRSLYGATVDYDEAFDVIGSQESLQRITTEDLPVVDEDPGRFVEQQEVDEIHPVEVEQVPYSRAGRAAAGGGGGGVVSLSDEFTPLEVQPGGWGQGQGEVVLCEGRAEAGGAVADYSEDAEEDDNVEPAASADQVEEVETAAGITAGEGDIAAGSEEVSTGDKEHGIPRDHHYHPESGIPEDSSSPRNYVPSLSPLNDVNTSEDAPMDYPDVHHHTISPRELKPMFPGAHSSGKLSPDSDCGDDDDPSGSEAESEAESEAGSEASGSARGVAYASNDETENTTESDLMTPSHIRMAHTLSEPYVPPLPTTSPPPITFTLEPEDNPEGSPGGGFQGYSPDVSSLTNSNKELNSSYNSNSPEIFPLQTALANIDLLAAAATTTARNLNSNNTNSAPYNNNTDKNTNSNNMLTDLHYAAQKVATASMSDSQLYRVLGAAEEDSDSFEMSYDVPVSGTRSATSCLSTTTDGTMYSALDGSSYSQDSASCNTVVDSGDDYQNDDDIDLQCDLQNELDLNGEYLVDLPEFCGSVLVAISDEEDENGDPQSTTL